MGHIAIFNLKAPFGPVPRTCHSPYKLEEAIAARLQAIFTDLDTQLESAEKSLRDLGFGSAVIQKPRHVSAEQIRETVKQMIGYLAPNINADTAAFWGNREISSGFELLKKVPKSTFQVLNAEKKGNVFHLSERYIFPAPDKTPEIYWDQEFICIGAGTRTLLVTASAPWSADKRPTELSWIDAWLAGLKVPLQ